MALRFEWSPVKAAANLAKHHVSFDEARTVFEDSLGQITDDPRHSVGEARYVLLGQSEKQRLLVVMFTDRADAIRSLVRAAPTGASGESMKKANQTPAKVSAVDDDDVLPEYDFDSARPNKHAARYAGGGVVVTLDPDVAAVFPDSAQANAALRALAQVIRAHHDGRAKKAESA